MARSFEIILTGADTLIEIFNRVSTGTFMRGVASGVFEEANTIMRASKRMVPLEDGILRASATVEQPIISGQLFSITMGYGGDASAYALIQHENMSFHHPGLQSKRRNQTGRTAKYLETPVVVALPHLEAKIARSVLAYFLTNGF